jgi:hypothetical protein
LGIPLLQRVSGSPYLWDMPNTTAPIRSTEEVARTIGENIKSALTVRGRNLEWLAGEIGIDVQSILKAFASHVDMWLILDASFFLEVSPDSLIEAR